MTDADYKNLIRIGVLESTRSTFKPVAKDATFLVAHHGAYRGVHKAAGVVFGDARVRQHKTVKVEYGKSFRHFPFGDVSIASVTKKN